MIASGVMLTALTSMAYVITNTLYDIAGARQRQTAIALADEAVEQARALPYATVALGVESAYLAGDPRVLGLGTPASPYVLATTGEELVHAANNSTVAPLVPNVSSRTVDGVVYAVRFYVSCFDNDCSLRLLTLTAYVDWRGGRGHRASSVRATSVVYPPQGACPPAVSPFAGQRPACLAATSSVTPGHLLLNGSGSGGATLTGTSNQLPSAASVLARGQVAAIKGLAKGGVIVVNGTPVAQPTSPTSADEDPVTQGIDEYAFHERVSTATSASASAGPGTVIQSLSDTTLDKSESASAVFAGRTIAPAPEDRCLDPFDVVQTDLLPCQRSVGEQAGTLRQVFDLTGLGLGTIALSEVAAPPSPVTAYTKYKGTGGVSPAPCASTSSTGCIHARASRSIGRLRVGGLPAAAAVPLLFSGYLYELDNYSDYASAEAGIRAGPPDHGASGELTYFTGDLGYATITLNASSTFSVATPVITTTVGLYTVSVSSTIQRRAQPNITSATGTCAGGLPCVTSAEVVVGSPIVATTSYKIETAGLTIYDLAVTVDLGDLRVQATHIDPR